MRNTFAKVVTDLARVRKDVCLLSGDIGNRMFDDFKNTANKRFLNCGIAEANMMSVAAGMALSGLRPFVYTITPFTTTRCLEQIRIGVGYHKAPVIIVGTGSGLSYAELGPTHHSLDDIAILRAVPEINICAPADSNELSEQIYEALQDDVPTYIRIGKKGEPQLHHHSGKLGIGRAHFLKDGSDVAILGIGPILGEAIKAAKELSSLGISAAVVSMGSVKPLDTQFLNELASQYSHWISIEEHSVIGGLGSSLLEWISVNCKSEVNLRRLGVPDAFLSKLGNQEYMRTQLCLDSVGISRSICEFLADKKL